MKKTVFTALILLSVNSYAMSMEEAKKILSTDESIEKVFELKKERTASLEVKQFDNKKLSIISVKDEKLAPLEAVIKDSVLTMGGHSIALNVEGNIINMDGDSKMCEKACLILPKDLEKFDGVIPGILVLVVSYFGPAVPQFVPVIITVEAIQ